MKYVITGATSFIGNELCQYLLTEGAEVYAVCRKGSNKIEFLPKDKNLHVVYANMSDYRMLNEQISYADVFVNLAWDATKHEGRDLKDEQWKNVENSIVSLIAARKMGCQLFVEAGSQAEYGVTLNNQTEQSECLPFTEYGKAKLSLKEMAFAYTKMIGMKYIHLRIFSTYGENDKSWTMVSSSIAKMLKNEPVDLSPCQQNWNFIYVKDAVKQIALLCNYAIKSESFTQEIFQIASEDTRPLKEFVEEMKSVAKSNSELRFGAIQPQQIVSLQPDISKTKNAIGFVSDYCFSDGIKNMINYVAN